jgi:DNA-binding NtrC family response regulator
VSRVVVRGPDGAELTSLDLPDGRVLLLGRLPDKRAAAELGPEVADRPVEAVPLGGTCVSANHAAIWRDGAGVSVRDIGSTNGTWLCLPQRQTVHIPTPDAEVQLARATGNEGAADEPAAPKWSRADEYASAIANSIQQWLDGHKVKVQAKVAAEPAANEPAQWRLPLATGQAIDIESDVTLHTRSSGMIEQLLRWTERQNVTFETEEQTRREGMILASTAIRLAHREVVEASKNGARAMLLTGPPGAGKEMLAEVFHLHSGRSGPLVALNCALLNKDMLHAQLFGAEPGSFTDAKRRMIGAVEQAQGGTLFLDEIGEMNSEVQPMFLRFLDRHEYQRLGQLGQVRRADVRVVAATNRDLREATRLGGFREDLWWRLSVWVVEVPPLWQRPDDVSAYLATIRTADGSSTLREALSPEAHDLLRSYRWGGNFRELRNFAERLSRGVHKKTIDVASCRRELERSAITSFAPIASAVDSLPADWTTLAARAVQAYKEDREREPSSWNEQKEWTEEYLKPLLFYQMSGAASHPAPAPGDAEALTLLANKCAARMKADRLTARKQLTRYFERFRT